MNNSLHEQICYRILLSIGDSLELKTMLSMSLSSYIRELGCTRGAVLLVPEKAEQNFRLALSFSIPRKIERHASFNILYEEIIHTTHIVKDEIVRKTDDGIYYVMGIGDIGLLVLFKAQGDIDEALLKALQPVNRKLGIACSTCRHNEAFQKSSRRFMEMANMLPGIIMEFDRSYRITFFNRRTQEIFKQVDSNEFRPDTIFDFFPESEDEDVKDLLLRIEEGEPMVTRDLWMQNSRNEQFKVNLLISPVSYRNEISGFRGIAIDITNRVKLEQDLIARDRILHAVTLATQELMRSSDFSGPLANALEIIGTATSMDRVYCFVNTLDKQGQVVTVSQSVEWSAEHAEPQIDNPNLQDIPAEAVELFLSPLRKKQPFLAIVRELPPSVTKDLLEEQDIQSLLVLPVHIKERFWGFIGFDDCRQERLWSDIEQGLLELFAVSLAETIERKEAEEQIRSLYEGILDDLDTAQTIQNYILPSWVTRKSALMISANYLPTEKIGGDLFDCIELTKNRYVVYMADISGHGVQAALIMTAVKSVIQMVVSGEKQDMQPGRVLSKLNSLLSADLFHENYMTLCFCYIDLETMTLKTLNAGHPPMVLLNTKKQTVKVLEGRGDIPLGWLPDYIYQEKGVETVSLEPDDVICLLTDGVFDTTDDEGTMLGVEQFYQSSVQKLLNVSSIMVPFTCYELLSDMGYHERSDDYTFAAISLLPEIRTPMQPGDSLASGAGLTPGDSLDPAGGGVTPGDSLDPRDSLDPAGAGVSKQFFHLAETVFSQVSPAAEACESYLHEGGFSEMTIIKAKMVISEFLSNIVKHGYRERSKDVVLIQVDITHGLIITFRDRASQWQLPPKEDSFSLFFDSLNQEKSHSGRGMQMIYSVTESHSRRRCHKINETVFTIAINEERDFTDP
jgi:phosphoserine phosphatase RsbU/P